MFYILAYLSIPSRKIRYQNQANDIIYRTLTTPGGVQSLAEQATVLECTRGFRSTIRKIFSLISYLSSCVVFFFSPNWDTASGSEFHLRNLNLLLKLGPNIWTMQHINKARIIISVKWSVRPQNVYRSMQWFNQVFEKKPLSESVFQIIIYSPLIIFIPYETNPFAFLLQVPHLTEFCIHILRIHSCQIGQACSLATLLFRCPDEFCLVYLKEKVIYFKSGQEASSYFSESYFF